ncbi:hypothetical protein PIB30_044533 [Stylosanthes scabra]|uniref:Uncharacterized protein n=1 Tax=Stylosanthes scabra TaxID=79078 RepID=A0ABU6SGM9_9FABA|nr:hypothetical protein [Stylosanthes scabra]
MKGLDLGVSRAPLHPRTLAPISDFSQVCPRKEENAAVAVAVRRDRGRPRRPCHSFSPSVQPQPPLKAQGAVLVESHADQPPLSHRSSRRHSFAVCSPLQREGEHPSHAYQSQESEIASSSFSPVSGLEGNSLHCLVKSVGLSNDGQDDSNEANLQRVFADFDD